MYQDLVGSNTVAKEIEGKQRVASVRQGVNSRQVSVETPTVDVQVIRLDKKQMTMSVFRQLDEELVFLADGGLRGRVWGRVNYKWKDSLASTEYYVVWQDGEFLKRSPVSRQESVGIDRYVWDRENLPKLPHGTLERNPMMVPLQMGKRRCAEALAQGDPRLYNHCLVKSVNQLRIDAQVASGQSDEARKAQESLLAAASAVGIPEDDIVMLATWDEVASVIENWRDAADVSIMEKEYSGRLDDGWDEIGLLTGKAGGPTVSEVREAILTGSNDEEMLRGVAELLTIVTHNIDLMTREWKRSEETFEANRDLLLSNMTAMRKLPQLFIAV